MTELSGKKIVLGVTGGIAAYKAAELTRLLVKAGANVHVVLTAAGARFVTAVTFQALSGNPVWSDIWDAHMPNNMAHIDLTRGATAALIAPASADIMAKLAHGQADDLLSTLCLARDCPLLIAPAMNRQMWEHPATQRNALQLQADGVTSLGPDTGEQACGEFGQGRMLEAADIFEGLVSHLQPKVLANKHVLITAGPTFEAIDPVRGITNISSGKMGYALARACAQAGASVTLVSGPVSLHTPFGVARISVRSAQDMHDVVMAHVAKKDVFIGVAAVADYRATQIAKDKIKKTGDTLSIELTRNADILTKVAALPNAPFCVGFAAESQKLDEHANGKRIAKNIPLVVGNLVQDGMGGDTNVVVLYDAQGKHPLPPATKDEVARGIVAHIAKLLTANS